MRDKRSTEPDKRTPQTERETTQPPFNQCWKNITVVTLNLLSNFVKITSEYKFEKKSGFYLVGVKCPLASVLILIHSNYINITQSNFNVKCPSTEKELFSPLN